MTSPKQLIELSILENASDFVEEALKNLEEADRDPKRWKFAIFNITQSIELIMKEALSREHQWLLFEDVDKQKFTVNWRTARARLDKLGKLDLSKQEQANLDFAFKKRNSIVHHSVEIIPEQLKPAFATLLGLTTHLYQTLLDDDLRNHVPKQLFRRIMDISDYGEEVLKQALKAPLDLDDNIRRCPDCGYESFKINCELEAECLVCHTKEERVWFCESCDDLIIGGDEYDLDGTVWCESCVYRQRDRDQYLEDEIMDRRR